MSNVQKWNSNQIKSDEIRNEVLADIFVYFPFHPEEIQFDKKLSALTLTCICKPLKLITKKSLHSFLIFIFAARRFITFPHSILRAKDGNSSQCCPINLGLAGENAQTFLPVKKFVYWKRGAMWKKIFEIFYIPEPLAKQLLLLLLIIGNPFRFVLSIYTMFFFLLARRHFNKIYFIMLIASRSFRRISLRQAPFPFSPLSQFQNWEGGERSYIKASNTHKIILRFTNCTFLA